MESNSKCQSSVINSTEDVNHNIALNCDILPDSDVSDVEVMQVVGNEVKLRSKKLRVGVNGNSSEGDLNRERPMSWEGELSDDDMKQEKDEKLFKYLPSSSSNHENYADLPNPPSSPMCISEKDDSIKSEEHVSCFKVRMFDKDNNTDSSSTVKAGTSTESSSNSSPVGPPQNHLSSQVLRVVSSPFNGAALFAETTHAGHRSSFANRIGLAYGQSPSPVFTRPSSSSSVSSYSPSQSPLMRRHVSSSSTLVPPAFAKHLPSTNGDISPSNSPLQRNHRSFEFNNSPVTSPCQSSTVPDNNVGLSPSQSPIQVRSLIVRPVSGNASPSHVRHSHTPDHTVTSLAETSSGANYLNSEQLAENCSSPGIHNHVPEPRSTTSSASVVSSASDESSTSDFSSPVRRPSSDVNGDDQRVSFSEASGSLGIAGNGVSRQQLLSGPCPICSDRISGFHYGIFSCESCKGFFKRTVQNKKNYVCIRGGTCHISISTRKKCPACRFDKCLKTGMKLEAIREDRTRGGRSTYQCTYSIPSQSEGWSTELSSASCHSDSPLRGSELGNYHDHATPDEFIHPPVPRLIEDILSVEHLWHVPDKESNKDPLQPPIPTEKVPDNDSDSLRNVADHRLYKIVKWCKSLPLFRDITIDDQIALLINSWCELLLLSCCYRSMKTPNEIRVSHGKSVNLAEAKAMGLAPFIERMLNLTEHLRGLQLDQQEYVCLKVIILLNSDASNLGEPEKVSLCQKQVLEALQTYTHMHYPHQPSMFGELLLRIPELERTCQVGKESLAQKQRSGEEPSFNLLMELLRGDN